MIIIALLSMSYQTDLNPSTTTDEPYQLSLQVKKLEDNNYNLIITMELGEGAHYVSPNSKGDYKGRFVMLLEENSKLTMNGNFSEHPIAKETIDPWRFDPVNFVTENTTHTQQFTVSDTNDFEVVGLIQFTIEPRCTLEKVKFTIASRDGNVTIKKLNTKK
jgi:hypothetical protein